MKKKSLALPFNSLFNILLTAFLLLLYFPIYSEKTNQDNEKKSKNFKIEYFGVVDASADHYEMAVSGKDEEEICKILKGLDSEREFKVKLSGSKSEIYKGSVYVGSEPTIQGFYFNAYENIPPNPKTKLELFLYVNGKEEKLDERLVEVPATSGPDKQPVITKLKPSGGVTGDTIVVLGKNFGKDIDKIEIFMHDPSLDEKKAGEIEKNANSEKSCLETSVSDTKMPSEYSTTLIRIYPKTLSQSDPKSGVQELAFSIPEDLDNFANESFIRKNLKLRINVNGRNSRFSRLTLLPENWNLKIIILSVFVTLLFVGLLSLLLRKWNILPNVLLDPETNTYSLSRFQAFAWTIVLVGSYFYIAICTGLVLRDGVIPDFNPSLIGLMSISYTGLISSHFLQKKNPKNEIRVSPPELSNLFSSNGVIDISRLQLLFFTLISIAVYLYNLAISNTLSGLPDIPPTLHGLLLASQGSYIGGKLFGDKIAINKIFPNIFPASSSEIEFNLIGGGFVEGMKVMLEGSEKAPVSANVSSESNLSCKLPTDNVPGKKNIVIIPPTGSSVTFYGVIELVESQGSETKEPEEKSAKAKKTKS